MQPGKWGTKIVFAAPIKKKKFRNGEEIEDKFFMLKTYTIFNIDQVPGDHLDDLRAGNSDDTRSEFERLEHAEAVFAATEADIRHGDDISLEQLCKDHPSVDVAREKLKRDSRRQLSKIAGQKIHS